MIIDYHPPRFWERIIVTYCVTSPLTRSSSSPLDLTNTHNPYVLLASNQALSLFSKKDYRIHYMNESDPRSDVHYLGSSENKA